MPISSLSLSFQNQVTIYQQNVICHVKDNEFNASYNPTLLKNNLNLEKFCGKKNLSELTMLDAKIIIGDLAGKI